MLKIVLTGEPCGGKTQATELLTKLLENRGYYIFICKEAATDIIMSGIKPNENILKNKGAVLFKNEWNTIKTIVGNSKVLCRNTKFDKRLVTQTLSRYGLIQKKQ